MLRALSFAALLSVAVGCGGARPPSAPPAGEPREAPAGPAATDAGPSEEAAAAIDAGAPLDGAEASDARGVDAAQVVRQPPPPVPRAGKVWPYHAWDRAEAVTFNHVQYQPGVPLYAYDETGESSFIVDRRPITPEQAKRAEQLVKDTKGDVLVSKCPFPRHSIILYEGDTAVASINVCFSCGDILVWPRWESGPVPAKMTRQELERQERRELEQLKLYKVAFPRWMTLFRDELGFPIDARYH